MEYWLTHSLEEIGDKLGKFILMDDSYKSCNGHSITHICVEVDISQGIFKFMELVIGNSSHTQILNYINFPFHYARCHHYGHILKECEKSFQKRVWHKMGEIPLD
jgi:hypothetical protein